MSPFLTSFLLGALGDLGESHFDSDRLSHHTSQRSSGFLTIGELALHWNAR